MLVLTRLVDEEIIIGDDIRIKVVSLSGNQVRLGIVAPEKVAVFRREVYEEVCRQNATAAQAQADDLTLLARQRACLHKVAAD